MGSYGSGRTRRHHITNECLCIDLATLRTFLRCGEHDIAATCTETRTVVTPANGSHRMTKQHRLSLSFTHYAPEEIGLCDTGLFWCWGAVGHVTLRYEEAREANIPIVTTSQNYGGVRYWMLAPCCGRRVRVLYLTPYDGLLSSLPQCRICLDLHYASQQQSFIEKHITYEKYLLVNYGWTWARYEYQGLKEHYFKITPEYAEKKARSEFEVQLRYIRHLIAFHRLMFKDHLRAFRTLRSQEDRCLYLEGLLQEWGTHHVLSLLEQSRGHQYATQEEIETLIAIIAGQPVTEPPHTYDFPRLCALKEQIEEELEALAA